MKLTRAGFFQSITGLLFGAAVAKAKVPTEPRLLYVSDVRPWRPPYRRVILEGKDISHVCQRAEVYSDGTLRCWCFQSVERDGYCYLLVSKNWGTLHEWRTGKGRLVWGNGPKPPKKQFVVVEDVLRPTHINISITADLDHKAIAEAVKDAIDRTDALTLQSSSRVRWLD